MKKLDLTVASLICGLFIFAASTPSALADAELEILVGSTEVFDSGDLAPASGLATPYSYSSGTTSFSLFYGWNNRSVFVGNGNILNLFGVEINSTVPVTFELSDNNNITAHNPASPIFTVVGVTGSGNFGSVSTYWSANNVLLAPTDQLFTFPLPHASESFYAEGFARFDASSPYSVTEVLTVTGVGIVDSVGTFIPDTGSSFELLAMAMGAIGTGRFLLRGRRA